MTSIEKVLNWHGIYGISSRAYTCGHCGNIVASDQGYCVEKMTFICIHICPHCSFPTFFSSSSQQIPGVAPGKPVDSLPKEIGQLYTEARNCAAASAYTGAVLLCRKLLMNIAVSKGGKEGLTFVEYVEFLASKGFVPPDAHGWVDHIRKKANEATHEIALMNQENAIDLISFSEMLLKIIYEFPSRIPPTPKVR
jgi:hypothetical protein